MESRRWRVFVSAFLVAVGAVVLITAGSIAGVGGSTGVTAVEETDPGEIDSVLLDIEVYGNGDASWRVEYRYGLDDENETEAFEDFEADVAANPETYEQRFRNGFAEVVASAEESTGREMDLGAVTVETRTDPLPSLDGQHGIVTYRFDWGGFAAVDDDTIRIGDSIHGFYLSPETTLIFRWPDVFELGEEPTPAAATQGADRVVWEGEQHFLSDEPDVVLEERPVGDTGDGDETDDADDADEDETDPEPRDDADESGIPFVLLGIALLFVLGLVGAGGFVILRRVDTSASESTDSTTAPVESSGGVVPAGEDAGGAGPQRGDEVRGDETGKGEDRREDAIRKSEEGRGDEEGRADEKVSGDAREEGGDAGGRDLPPPELMSNEERVITALEQNGGRMKQKHLADQCDWHASKTSKVVTELKEDDVINVFRIGRENILTFPDETLGNLDDE